MGRVRVAGEARRMNEAPDRPARLEPVENFPHEPGAAPARLATAAVVVDAAPLFPGFRLPAAEVFAAGAGAAGLPSP